jgi:uncharacterized protein YkwD
VLKALAGSRPRAAGRLGFAVLAVAVAAAASMMVASRARADSSSSLVSLTNGARAANGLPALSVAADLSAVARQQASRMAASGTLAHTPNLPQAVCCWSSIGENVGEAGSVSALQAAFMASPQHRANILSGTYTQIGVGVAVDAKGTMWASEIFRRPSGATPTPAPRAPAPVHAAAPPQRATTGAAAPAAQPPKAVAAAPAGQDRASRDLPAGRLPLEEAQRYAAQLAAARVVDGRDPVSRVLAFAAMAASLPAQ